MNFKKRGLGRGLEALLADVSNKNTHTLLIDHDEDDCQPEHQFQETSYISTSIGSTASASDFAASELKKYQRVVENSRKRVRQLQELPAANLDVEAMSAVVRMLIDDVKRDNLALLEEAESLMRLFDEFESIISGQ